MKMNIHEKRKGPAEKQTYHAMAYYRLSKDDGTKHESDSISNQRKLIHEYVSQHPDLELVDEAFDDGYTGTNYDRPGFQTVMDAIQDKRVNCVIVKDLSRLGREYIETGKYLEMVFPAMGVRFIAINDDVDSEHKSSGDDIIIPVKNIMNESYCRELSKKLRRQFRIQRSNGEFIGAFACYGYLKSPEDKHKLVIDEYASEVVKAIFGMKMKGYSQQAIADELNAGDILPPAEYKKHLGLAYQCGFKGAGKGRWSAVTITNILTNQVYIGDLVQGKRGTPNYKIKKSRLRDEEDWVVAKNTHEAIIDPLVFETVQNMMKRDTRTSPKEDVVFPLAGLLYCADCGRPMSRRSVTKGTRRFSYYICSTNKRKEGCTSHSMEQKKLENLVATALIEQVHLIVETKELLAQIGQSNLTASRMKRLDRMIEEKDREIEGNKGYRMKLMEALADELIDRDEYQKMWQSYTQRIEAAQAAIDKLCQEKKRLSEEDDADRGWMDWFSGFEGFGRLNREMAVAMIDRVLVCQDKTIVIDFNYRDELAAYRELLQKAQEVG